MGTSWRQASPAAFRAFFEVVEARRAEIDRAVAAAAARIPVFARAAERAAAERASPERAAAQEEQRAASMRLQRAALVDGDWEPWLRTLRAQGENFARLDIGFEDWFGLLTPYRRAVTEGILPEESSARDILDGMDGFVDGALAAIGEAYVAAKEQQVRRAESQLHVYVQTVERAQVGVLVYYWESPPDPGSLRLILQNAAALRLGRTTERVGRTLAEYAPETLRGPVAAHYVAALQDGTPRSWTLDWTHEDGGIVSYEAHCYRIADRHLAVFFEDVSERRRIERELARHVRELERSNRDLDEFAYIASHDLKSPLRDIHNLATWVSEDLEGQVPEGTARHLALMRDRVSRMEQLLDDLLQYSRAGRVNAQVEDVRVATAIESAVAILDLGGHALRIHADNSTVRAPRAAVELVLRNLVANSIRHHDRPAGVVEIDVRPEPGQVCVEVRDDGPGIPPEHAERVFRMFQTLRPREDGGGNGMGLAVVKKVMESCGGRVELHSNGRGTTMRTYWPVGRER